MAKERWIPCEKQPWVCPHIVHLDKSVIELTRTFWLLIESITNWNADLTKDAEAIISALKNTFSIEELKRTISDSTQWILERQTAMMSEIDTLKQNVEKLQKDDLTWLYRRERYTEDFTNLKNNLLEKQEKFSCAVIDVDNFKKINDTHTHTGWDKVLQYLAEVLKRKFWDKNIYRYGGEEFMILYKWSKATLEKWLNEVLEFLHNPISRKSMKIPITFSWGVTECTLNDTSDSLFKRADALMYEVKHNGKNRVLTD